MESISLKLEKEFLKVIENAMRKHNYTTKTEFIRESIRDKIRRLEGNSDNISKKDKENVELKIRSPLYIN